MANLSDTPETAILSPPLPTPTNGNTGTFSIRSSITISASALSLAQIILTPSLYPEWCTFCPSAVITSQPATADAKSPSPPITTDGFQKGTKFYFNVHMTGNGLSADVKPSEARQTALEVLIIEELDDGRKGWRVTWGGTIAGGWLLKSERVHEFVETEDAGVVTTAYTNWETFGGPLAPVVKMAESTRLAERFGDWAADLKKFAEGRKAGETKQVQTA